MSDEEILELLSTAKTLVGEKRWWIAYPGDKTEVTCSHSGVGITITQTGADGKIGQVWTTYLDRWGKTQAVWFSLSTWYGMEKLSAREHP